MRKGLAIGRVRGGIRVMVMDRQDFLPSDVRIDPKTGDALIDGTPFDPREVAAIAEYVEKRTAARARSKSKRKKGS